MRTLVVLIFFSPVFSFGSVTCLHHSNNQWDRGKLFELCQSFAEQMCLPRPGLTADEKPGAGRQVTAVTYGIFGARGAMNNLTTEAQSIAKRYQAFTPCPEGCTKSGSPQIEIFTKPTATISSPSCPSVPTKIVMSSTEVESFNNKEPFTQNQYGFRRVFKHGRNAEACRETAESWAQDMVTGGSDLGEFVEETKCQDPCSYTSSIRTTPQPAPAGGCEMVVEIKILCGPPKKSREWTSYAVVKNEYVCEPNP